MLVKALARWNGKSFFNINCGASYIKKDWNDSWIKLLKIILLLKLPEV